MIKKYSCHDNKDNLSIFNSLYTSKNVLLIGPAECIVDELGDITDHDFDIVVKLNHHWNKYNITEHGDDIARLVARHDIIYHDLKPASYSKKDITSWVEHNTIIVTRWSEDSSRFNTFRERVRGEDILYYNTPEFYNDLHLYFDSLPFTGIYTLMHILNYMPGKLTCIGFDFYLNSHYIHNIKIHKKKFGGGHNREKTINRLRELLPTYNMLNLGAMMESCLFNIKEEDVKS